MRSLLNPSSIGFRMLAFLLVGGLMPIAILGGIIFRFIEHELQDHLGRTLSVEVEELRNLIDLEMMSTYLELRRLAREDALFSEPREVFRSFLRRAAASPNYYSRDRYRCLAVIDSSRSMVSRVGDCRHFSQRSASRERIFADGGRVSDVYTLGAESPAVDFWLPAEARETESSEGLWVTVNLIYLSDLLAQRPYVGGVYHDILIYTADQLMVGRKDLGRGLLSNVAAGYPLVEEALAAGEGYAVGEVTGGGRAVGAALAPIGLVEDLEPLRDWRVAIVQPLDDRSEPTVVLIERLRFGLKVAVLLTVAYSLLMALVLMRGIIGPVRQLIGATLLVRRGDLSTPIRIRGVDELSQLGIFFNEMRAQLKGLMDQLTEMATTDQLTGLANRRSLNTRMEDEIKRVRRYGQTLSFAVMDLDRFKRINDKHGHAFGDTVLQRVAGLCRGLCRETDLMARFGGEEFAFVLPQTTKIQAISIMERVRDAVESAEITDRMGGPRVAVTVSVGIANLPEDSADQDALFRVADEALYRAKSSGRNRVAAA